MNNNRHFDALIVVTPDDCKRLMQLYPRLVDNFSYGQICFIGSAGVGEIALKDPAIGDKVKWVDENDIIPFSDVHECMGRRLQDMLKGEPLPRGITGWYYQQFLKMQYSAFCQDEYYMVWDGDTVPCRPIKMFSDDTGKPYLDLKHEYHPEYFETLGKILPGMKKVIERSFISEHMLMKKDIMQSLIRDIEANDNIPGDKFWEKIINCIEPEKIYDSSFSEFETYGTYVALKYSSLYRLREWHSFRLGGSFFKIDTICDRDFIWLGKDFDAISFEKGQEGTGENYHFFDNPEYQQKLSAKKMLQIAQMEYRDGYKEIWEDDLSVDKDANVRIGGYHTGKEKVNNTVVVVVTYNNLFFTKACIQSIRDNLSKDSYKVVVVDNASTDGVTRWLEEQEDIILIKNNENVGFGPACNQAVKATMGTEYENWDVYLLNNDTRLIFDALYFLKKVLYSSKDIGAVGSISNNAGNKQSIEVEFAEIDDYIKYGEKVNVPMVNPCLERVRLSGFSLLIRRMVWDEIGGFDEDFVPGYFEDDALSMEILRRGYRLELVRNSFVYHSGSESFGRIKFDKIVRKNHELFQKKYGFDIMKYAYASEKVISQIPYEADAKFSVLHYGCGLGSEMKAIRSLYPESECIGIETNSRIRDIGRFTEQVFGSLEELLEFIKEPRFNILIIEKKDLDTMDEAVKAVISEILLPESVILIKHEEYEELSYEKIKFVIWNMDNTFWQEKREGEEAVIPMNFAELIKTMTDHGVISSIVSCNEEDVVISKLEDIGIADLSVFNSIGTEEKRVQISEILKILDISPSQVLYIDNDVITREENACYLEGMFTAGLDIIPYLITYFGKKKAKDKERKVLSIFRLMEKKYRFKAEGFSEETFLKDSNIKITINHNCLKELDEICELVEKSSRLNYTKNYDSRQILEAFIASDWYDCAYVRARDRFGNYGIVGFYCYNMRENKIEHFLFSNIVSGMGIDQYVYDVLGNPPIEINGVVEHELTSGADISWIYRDKYSEIDSDPLLDKKPKILMKGPVGLNDIYPYMSGGRVTIEDDYQKKETRLFNGTYSVICLEVIPDGEELGSETDLGELLKNLDYIYENVKGRPSIILMTTEAYDEIVEEFALDHDKVIALNVSEMIGTQNKNIYYKIAGEICSYINKSI